MLVNLTDVFISEGKVMEIPYEISEEYFLYQSQKFFILQKDPIYLKVVGLGSGKAEISAGICLTIRINCDRCLKSVEKKISFPLCRKVASPECRELDDTDDELEFMEGYQLNVDNLVNSEILMNWPLKILCQADCKGICKLCGKDLNDGDCKCDTFIPDPRMAVIKDIFHANKEV